MNKFLKISLILFLCSLSISIFSQSVYDNNQDGDIVVSLITKAGDSSFNLFEETSTSSTTNRTHSVYIPVAGAESLDNRDFSYFSNREDLPQISGGSSEENENFLEFSLYTDVVGDYIYLNVAISSESSPTTFDSVGSIAFATFSDESRTVRIDLKDLCAYDSDIFDCSKFNFEDYPSDDDELSLFFFLADSNLSNKTAVTKEDYSGVVYNLHFSNRVYTESPRLDDLAKGDSQLNATVDGFELDNDFNSWFAHVDSSVCEDDLGSVDQTLSSLGLDRSNLRDLEYTGIDGVIKVNELENGTCYSIRLFECDKYGFCSYGTEKMSGTPEEIAALLEKQSCFFFTAGFNGEHYVVTYFQYWRDHFLSKTWLGREFISWYYRTAPQYTPYILDRPWLQSLIRSIGYILYGIIKGWWMILSCLFFIGILRKVTLKKRKSELL